MASVPTHVVSAAKASVKPVEKPIEYTVVSGDTLSEIASSYSLQWQRLYDKNTTIANPDLIIPGDKLQIPKDTETIAVRTYTAPVAAPEAPVAPEAPTAPAEEPTPAPAPVVVAPAPEPAPAPVQVASSGCGDNDMAHYIYMHESTCNTSAMNSGGCYGIGQDCNGAVMNECGADYTCQNAFFTRYANARYGGWEGAYSFWLANNWW